MVVGAREGQRRGRALIAVLDEGENEGVDVCGRGFVTCSVIFNLMYISFK